MMRRRSPKRSAKPTTILIGAGVLVLLGLVAAVAATLRNDDSEWPGQGTKWEGTLASTAFALDAETGQVRWQRSMQGAPQLVALRMPRAQVITLEGIIFDDPCSGRPVSIDLDVGKGNEMGRRNRLSFTDTVPTPPHGPVVAVQGDTTFRVEAISTGSIVRAVSGAGVTRWQRAFPDPDDDFMSVPDVVAGVVDQKGSLFVAGSADYLGPRRCAGR